MDIHCFLLSSFCFIGEVILQGIKKRRLKVALLKGIKKKKSLGYQAFHNKKGQLNVVKKIEVWYNGSQKMKNTVCLSLCFCPSLSFSLPPSLPHPLSHCMLYVHVCTHVCLYNQKTLETSAVLTSVSWFYLNQDGKQALWF